MTKVILDNGRRSHAVRALGHATPDPASGPDLERTGALVCAAVSALVQALGAWMLRQGRRDDIVWMEAGDALLFSSDADPRITAAFDVTVTGLKMLANTYPSHIQVEDWTQPDNDGQNPPRRGTRPCRGRVYTGENAGGQPRQEIGRFTMEWMKTTLRLDQFDGGGGEGTTGGQAPAGTETRGGAPGPRMGRAGETPGAPPAIDRQGRFLGRTLGRWNSQAAQAARSYPGLDLDAEARDPRFRQLLRAGVPVKTAYEAVHHDQLLRAAAQAAEKSVVDGVRARGARPGENGTAAQSGFVVKEDVSRLTRKEMEDISRRVMRGEKISFG